MYLSVCGFNTAIVLKDLDDADIEYVEKFVRTKLQILIDTHLKKYTEHPSDSSCFYG